MAKKVKKSAKKPVKRSTKRVAKAVPAVKAETVKKGGNYLMTIVIIIVLAGAAAAATIVYSNMSNAKKAAEVVPTAVVINTPVVSTVPAAAATVIRTSINIKDPKTGKIISIPVKPASASSSGSAAAVPPQPPANAPAAAPTSTDIPSRCKIYFKDVVTKETINRIDIEDAKYLYDSGKAIFIDARGKNEYEEAHIKDSISIPAGSTQDVVASFKDKLKDKVLVTYCHGVGCHLSDKTAYLLWDAGYRKVAIFFGGWPKWNEHKYPIEKK
jgi:rhodanese-related sulfurtransferase